MINAIDNGILITDLDADSFDILNVGSLLPVPGNLVGLDDPRLTDSRVPINGSVTNTSVAADAAIVQSKLLLNGVIPPGWLGITGTTAAQGDLVEYISNKGIANGYASLDGTGKLPLAQLPADAGTGTVTSVALTMPAEFGVTGSPVATSGTLAVAWENVVAYSWLGNKTAGSAVPAFTTDPIPVSLLVDLPASKVTSGVFDPALLPVAVGVGPSAAPGVVPDPGASGDATDYLSRNMTYEPVPSVGPTYQPVVPDPTITPGYPAYEGTLHVIEDSLAGVSLFYALGIGSPGTYQELPLTGYVIVPTGQTIWVYGAKSGYNNSTVVTG